MPLGASSPPRALPSPPPPRRRATSGGRVLLHQPGQSAGKDASASEPRLRLGAGLAAIGSTRASRGRTASSDDLGHVEEVARLVRQPVADGAGRLLVGGHGQQPGDGLHRLGGAAGTRVTEAGSGCPTWGISAAIRLIFTRSGRRVSPSPEHPRRPARAAGRRGSPARGRSPAPGGARAGPLLDPLGHASAAPSVSPSATIARASAASLAAALEAVDEAACRS